MFKSQKKINRFKNHYLNFCDLSSFLVAGNAVCAFLLSSILLYILNMVLPDYLTILFSSQTLSLGLKGWIITFYLTLFSCGAWYFGNIAWRCNNILRERLFK